MPPGVPLAGYGSPSRRLPVPDVLGWYPHAFWLKPSTGTRDPIMARALVLESGHERLLWVAIDLVAVDPGFVADVAARAAAAGFRYSATVVSASHTHSGPGAFIDSTLFSILTADRFDARVRRALIEGVSDAVRRAEHAKRRARVGSGTAMAPTLTESRLELPLDPEIAVLKFVADDGAPIALLWNYAIHGTTLGPRNLRLSADVMGMASGRLERALGAPALFVNGAVGDVSPRGHGDLAVAELGGRLADAVSSAAKRAQPRGGATLSVTRGQVELPPPFVSVRNCVGRWVPGFVTIPLGGAMPRSAELLAVTVGDTAWVTIPGELQTELGQVVKKAGRRHFDVAFVAGLSNGYLGYLLTPGAYRRTGYIECASLYGERAGERVAGVAARLLERLGAARARRARSDAGRALISSAPPCCGGSRLW